MFGEEGGDFGVVEVAEGAGGDGDGVTVLVATAGGEGVDGGGVVSREGEVLD